MSKYKLKINEGDGMVMVIKLKNIKLGIKSYIKLNGYTINSFAKKHNIDVISFKNLLSINCDIDATMQIKIFEKIMNEEGLTDDDINNYVIQLTEERNKLSESMDKQKKLMKSNDFNRIEPFLEELKEVWDMYPELRFGQLVTIVSSKIDGDIFYTEDDVFLDAIRKTF